MLRKNVLIFNHYEAVGVIVCYLLIFSQSSWGLGFGKKKIEPNPKKEVTLEQAQEMGQQAVEEQSRLKMQLHEVTRATHQMFREQRVVARRLATGIQRLGDPSQEDLEVELDEMLQEDQNTDLEEGCANSTENLRKLGILIASHHQTLVRAEGKIAQIEPEYNAARSAYLKNKENVSFKNKALQLLRRLKSFQAEREKWAQAENNKKSMCEKIAKKCYSQKSPQKVCATFITSGQARLEAQSVNPTSISDEDGVKSGSLVRPGDFGGQSERRGTGSSRGAK